MTKIESSIKAVILDYGKVLSRSPAAEEFGHMAKMFNVGFDSFCEHWQSGRDVYDRGDVTAEEYWMKLAAQTNTSISPNRSRLCGRSKLKSGPISIPTCSIG